MWPVIFKHSSESARLSSLSQFVLCRSWLPSLLILSTGLSSTSIPARDTFEVALPVVCSKSEGSLGESSACLGWGRWGYLKLGTNEGERHPNSKMGRRETGWHKPWCVGLEIHLM